MNEKDILCPFSITFMCNTGISALEASNNDVPPVIESINQFVQDNNLEGQAMNACKLHMDNYINVLNYYVEANNDDIADYNKLKDTVSGVAYLKGAEILQEIQRAIDDRDRYQAIGDQWSSRADNCETEIVAFMCRCTASIYYSKRDAAEQRRLLWQAKKELFESIESSTSGLFKNSIPKRTIINAALAGMANSYDPKTGTYTSSYGAAWRGALLEKLGLDPDVNPNMTIEEFDKFMKDSDPELCEGLTRVLLDIEPSKYTQAQIEIIGKLFEYGNIENIVVRDMIMAELTVFEGDYVCSDYDKYVRLDPRADYSHKYSINYDFYNAIYSDSLSAEARSILGVVEYNSKKSQFFEYASRIDSLYGKKYSEEKVQTFEVVLVTMLAAGFEPEFIAGVLGNIANEGNAGRIENTHYSDEKMPRYVRDVNNLNVDGKKFWDYASNKNIQEVGISYLDHVDEELDKMSGSRSAKVKDLRIGIGMCQWTADNRYSHLIQCYKDACGGNNYPTAEQCYLAESQFMIEELSEGGSYHSVYTYWKDAYTPGKVSTLESIERSMYRVNDKYEVCDGHGTYGVNKTRGQDAVALYNVIAETNYAYDANLIPNK